MGDNRMIKLNKKDNVVTVLKDMKPGEELLFTDAKLVKIKEEIPAGFKVSIKDINKGELIIKYGETIGMAIFDIKLGEKVHVHNIEGLRGRGDKKPMEDNVQ
ncbi:MAG: UxaA family hydrolase [Halarsenatibacteraceae bacterium]